MRDRIVWRSFAAEDVDGDGNKEFLVGNNKGGWIGVLKWDPTP